MIRKLLIISFLISICACASIIKFPDNTDLQYSKIKYPDSKLTDLEEGYRLYIKKCGGCHSLYSPRYYSNKEWDEDLPEMLLRSKTNAIEENHIRRYIYTMNRDTLLDSINIPNFKKNKF